MKIELNKTYLTRDGRKARVICVDVNNGLYSVIALVTNNNNLEAALSYYKSGHFYSNARTAGSDLVSEYSPWNDVAVDTKVIVGETVSCNFNMHFSHYSNGKIYTFTNGRTSFTNDGFDCVEWDYGEVYEETN